MPLTEGDLTERVGHALYNDGEPANASTLNRPLLELRNNDVNIYRFFRGIILDLIKYYWGSLTSREAVLISYPASFSIFSSDSSQQIRLNGDFVFLYHGVLSKASGTFALGRQLVAGKKYYIVASLPVYDNESWGKYINGEIPGQEGLFIGVNVRVEERIDGLQDEPDLHYFVIGYFVYLPDKNPYRFDDPKDFVFLRGVANDIGVLDKALVDLVTKFESEFFQRLSWLWDSMRNFILSVFTPGVLPLNSFEFEISEDDFVIVKKGAAVLGNGEVVVITNALNTGIKAVGSKGIYIHSVNFKPYFTDMPPADTRSYVQIANIIGGKIDVNYKPPLAKLRASAGIVFEGLHNVNEYPKRGELRYSNGYLAYALQEGNPESFAIISTYNTGFANILNFGYYNEAGSTQETITLQSGGSKYIIIPSGYISSALAYVETMTGGNYYYSFNDFVRNIDQPLIMSVHYERGEDRDAFVIRFQRTGGSDFEELRLTTNDNITTGIKAIVFSFFLNVQVAVEFR